MTSFPGLQKFHPLSNEDYLVRSRLRSTARAADEFVATTKAWRPWWRGNQGEVPACTAVGSLINLACEPMRHTGYNPMLDWRQLYRMNQEEDRRQGRNYAEGATTVAAMQVLVKLGLITAYYWGYTVRTCQEVIKVKPFIVGTNWYSSMFDRDAQGIIRITPGATSVGGHLYTINKYDHRRDLWRCPNSWGDGDYYFDSETLLRLLREDGEMTMMDEVASPQFPIPLY